jgi:hypothetical protein
LAAALGVLAVLVSGCTEKQPANDTLPPTSSSAPSESAELLGPPDAPLPASARENSPEGFNEFTQYYIGLINRLQEDLNPQYLRQFSRGCDTCDRLANDAEGDAKKGYRYEGGTITIKAIAPASLQKDGMETAFVIDQAAYTVLDANGQAVQGLSGEPLTDIPAGMSGVWLNDRWIVTNLSFG